MKQYIGIFCFALPAMLFAQPASPSVKDTTRQEASKPKAEPVKSTFECPWLIDNQTVEGTPKHSMFFIIQHRFGDLDHYNASSDFFGIYAASANIRLGLNYGITKWLSVGVGVTKNNMLYDFEWKAILLRQKHGASPVTVTYYGNVMRSAAPQTGFINQSGAYNANDRFSYFNEIMVASKITDKISLQVGGSYTYVNLVDSTQMNGILGVSIIGRYKFTTQSSLQVEFDNPLTLQPNSTYDGTVISTQQKPNLGIGYEVSTGNHQFQIFICTANNITGQQIMEYNTNDFTKKQFVLGFNITRLFDF
jgi:hypothetical protein